MKAIVQARLDEETQAALERLVQFRGMKPSEVVRESIRLMDKHHAAPARPRLIGIGEYESGIPDLATNKKHMQGFGAKSMGNGWRPPKARAK
jgi:hypothetical protein